MLIVTRTPLRASFVGGGTDLPSFYREHGGEVISTALGLYVDVIVRRRPEGSGPRFRIACGVYEEADHVEAIEHPIVREALRASGDAGPLDISSSSDVPGGTGLGSSSTFCVGLLHALRRLHGEATDWRALAEAAFTLETQRLSQPIGRQDQTIAAVGGLRHLRFARDEQVDATPVDLPAEDRDALEASLLLFYLGGQRRADRLLRPLSRPSAEQTARLRAIRGHCEAFGAALARRAPVRELGELLHETWQVKRRLTAGVSSPRIDEAYDQARAHGAIGGKLLGAGGTGCLLLVAEPARHAQIRRALAASTELPVRFDPRGSRVLLAQPSTPDR
ncbi:MAG: GHMP kinase [Myxococcales bacterium]|nr:GHMP kinase [Myxococcales bacterium]